jgi:hypothetical protein
MDIRYATLSKPLFEAPVLSDLDQAIFRTIAYADVFNYPLQDVELQRYLIGARASLPEVREALSGRIWGHAHQDGSFSPYVTLHGREEIVPLRQQRQQAAARLWPKAIRYGRIIAHLPFVRMVAVTGALAVDNESGPDIDYLIVAEAGRLWLCRGLTILLVHWAARFGDLICPNYLISDKALVFSDQNLYTAHEVVQMVPLSGLNVYWEMRRLNAWTQDYLPNAAGLPRADLGILPVSGAGVLRVLTERALRTPPGSWIEAWEMSRKVRKFTALRAKQLPRSGGQMNTEADFCADWCKGHFGGYGQSTMAAYQERLSAWGLVA